MVPDQLHPYVTASLTVLWIPASLTGETPAAAILTTNDKPAYRLTPQVFAVLHANVDQLEQRWTADLTGGGLTVERRAALERAAAVLGELWEWLVARAPTGTIATADMQPARLPDVRKLVKEGEQVGRAPSLEEWNPTLPLPVWVQPVAKVVAAGSSAPVAEIQAQPGRKGKPTTSRPSRSKRDRGDAIATGRDGARPEPGGLFD